nr:peptidylprolyl isomerase [Aestuariirhabdus litorea]
MTKKRAAWRVCALCCLGAAPAWGQQCVQQNGDNAPEGVKVAATVNGMEIGDIELRASESLTARERYYHFSVPEGDEGGFRREVLDLLVDSRLLAKEALKRGLTVDDPSIQANLANLDGQYGDNPAWEAQRANILAFHQCRQERIQLVKQLESQVKEAASVTPEEVKAYYLRHPDKFTSPVQQRVSVILLAVAPSAPSARWQEVGELAQTLYMALEEGGDFASLALEYSGDPSAERGGDMGFIHQGMLGETVEEALDGAEVGDLLKPIRLLEGWLIIRLDERNPQKLNALADVYDRAEALAKREQGEQRWMELIKRLRSQSDISLSEEYRQPAGVAAGAEEPPEPTRGEPGS